VLMTFMLGGCSFAWIDGGMPPSGNESRIIVTRTDQNATIEVVSVDRLGVDLNANAMNLPAGEHLVALNYRVEAREDCDTGSTLCSSTTLHGECKGSLRTLPGRPYLLSLDTRFGEVSAQVAPKGLFDLFSRTDEPNIGALTCNVPTRLEDFRRTL